MDPSKAYRINNATLKINSENQGILCISGEWPPNNPDDRFAERQYREVNEIFDTPEKALKRLKEICSMSNYSHGYETVYKKKP